ncbi:unnamed protein product [Durusdinium trenchii]|uniref:Uncharacterized protein n=2 Tax=Durusdinium trenchii TaxID=1381693 RepID=A0ABP0NE36_9DINO
MATAVVVGEKPPDAEASAQGDSHGTKRGRQASKKKVAKKALVLPTPMPPIGQKAFICEGTSCDLVRRVLTHWGWTESPVERPSACQLKWTFRSRDAEKSVLEPWQLINHFHGSYYLSNKAFLGQCLQSCSCCSSFFPRQYDLRDAFGMRCFLRDYVLTAAEQVLRSPAAKIPTSGGISPREVALRVLRRYKEWSKGHADHPERLLRCPHEIAALLGHGCLLPRKISVHQRIHVDVFLSRSMRSECPVCQEDPKPQSGDSHPLQQRYLDGPQNIWALKEPCVQKGKGVTILSGLAPLLEDYEQHRATGQGRDCVAQKYIERPLLVNQPHGPAKCDLRVWVLVLDWNPLTVFVHPEVYFRIATRPFQFDSMEPNAHKTNCRDTENRVPMKVLFESVGHGAAERWKTRTWPRLLDAVRASLFATQCTMASNRNTSAKAFELFGLDFGLDESWQPWLLEINTSPCMLDDCKGEYEEEIKAWAWEATESLLKLVLAFHDGSWKLPSYVELLQKSAEERSGQGGVERLFEEEVGRAEHSPCLGRMVRSVSPCLASGLSLEGPCGRWCLILREKVLDEMSLRQAHEALQRRIFQGVSARETSVSKLLREWLLPSEEEPISQAARRMSKTCPKMSLKRATSQPAALRTQTEGPGLVVVFQGVGQKRIIF